MDRFARRPILAAAIATALLATLVVTPAQGQPEATVVDQTLPGDPACTVENFPTEPVLDSLTPLRQTFVPSGGAISAVDLCLTVDAAASVTGSLDAPRVRIKDTAAGTAVGAGALTAAQVAAVAGTTGFVRVPLDQTAPLTPGRTYTIELTAPRVTYRWRATCGVNVSCDDAPVEGYDDGAATGLVGVGSLLLQDDPAADLGFRTVLPDAGDLAPSATVPALVCPDAASLAEATVTVANRGGNTTADFRLDIAFERDGERTPVASRSVAGLGVGESVTFTGHELGLPAPPAGVGRAALVVEVDAPREVAEADEMNNVASAATTLVSCAPGELVDARLVAGDGSTQEVPAGLVDVPLATLDAADLVAALGGLVRAEETIQDGAPTSSDPASTENLQASGNRFGGNRFGGNRFGGNRFGGNRFGGNRFGDLEVGGNRFGGNRFGGNRFGGNRFGGSSQLSTLLSGVSDDVLRGVSLASLGFDDLGVEDLLYAYPNQPDVTDPQAATLAAQAVLDLAPQDRTLFHVLRQLDPPLALGIDDVDLAGAMDLSLVATLLATQPLASLPVPAGAADWCAHLAATSSLDCADDGIDPATEALASLDLRGYDMGQVDIGGVLVADIGLRPDTLLAAMPLATVDDAPVDGAPATDDRLFLTSLTSLRHLTVTEAFALPGDLLDCSVPQDGEDPCGFTVADAEGAFAFRSGRTFADLLNGLTPTAASLLDIPNALLGAATAADIPWARLDTDLLDADELSDGTCPTTDYTFTAAVAGAAIADPVVELVAPRGFDPRDGQATALADGAAVAATVVDATGPDARTTITVSVDAIVHDSLSVTVPLCANATLGTVGADASARWRTFDGGTPPTVRSLSTAADTAAAQVTVVEAEEPDEVHEVTRVLRGDGIVYRHVPAGDDVDAFTIPVGQDLPGGGRIEPGDLIRVRLGMPAGVGADGEVLDLDLTVYGTGSGGLVADILAPTPLTDAGAPIVPLDDDAQQVDGQDASQSPEVVQDAGNRFGGNRFGGNRFGGNRFGGNRFGGNRFGTIETAPTIVSQERGNRTEFVEFVVPEGETGEYTVQVSSFLDGDDHRPYALSLQVLTPTIDPALAACDPVLDGPLPTLEGSLPTVPADARTLILVDEAASVALHGAAPTAAMMDRLQSLAAHARVNGVVLPVDRDPAVHAASEAWRSTDAWCSPLAANRVVGAVRQLVVDAAAAAPQLEHVVIVGGDRLFPFARVPDDVTLANEQAYTGEAIFTTGSNNPLVAAFAAGTTLTDDPLGTIRPRPWLDEALWVPELAVGRLVEGPADVMAAVDQFIASDGLLQQQAALAAGYDFMADGAEAAADGLVDLTQLPTAVDRALAAGGWTVDDLAAQLAAAGADGPDLASVNGHATHDALLGAVGDATRDHSDVLTTRDALDAGVPLGTVLFSIGCHFGLNVPDELATDTPAVVDVDGDVLDWTQLVTSRAGIMVGNTGYGYGTDEDVSYSERLLAAFAAQTARTGTLGDALAAAKAEYIAGIATPSDLDRKSLQQLTLYGLPMYRFHDTPPVSDDAVVPTIAPDPATGVDAFGFSTGTLPVGDGCSDCLAVRTSATDSGGRYYDVVGPTVNGDPLVVQGRAIVPQLSRRYALPAGTEVGGFIPSTILSELVPGDGGPDTFDPVIARAVLADADVERPVESLDQSGPGTRARFSPVGDETVMTLPLGSFRGVDLADSEVVGTMRLDTRVEGTVYLRDTSDAEVDRFAPEFTDLELVRRPSQTGGHVLDVRTTLVDDSGVARAVAAVFVGGVWRFVELRVGAAVDGVQEAHGSIAIPADAPITAVQYYALDVNGNVGTGNHKGTVPRSELAQVIEGDPTIELVGVLVGAEVEVDGAVGPAYRSEVSLVVRDGDAAPYGVYLDGGSEPVALLWPAGTGDGTTTDRYVFAQSGDYFVRVASVDDPSRSASFAFTIDVTPPTVTLTAPTPAPDGSGGLTLGSFTYGDEVPVSFTCADNRSLPANVVCEALGGVRADGTLDTTPVPGTTTQLTLRAVDQAGHETLVTYSYTVRPRHRIDGFYSPVQNGVATKADRNSVPFKFRVYDIVAMPEVEVTDPSVVATLARQPVHCTTLKPTGEVEPAVSADDTGLQYVDGQFKFVAEFPDRHCYRFTVTLVDGVQLTALVLDP